MATRTLHFEHRGASYRAEVQDYDDCESSDTVEIFSPDGKFVSSYDTCTRDDAEIVAEARHEIRD